MTRRRAKSLFVVFAILLAVCLVAAFVNFTYPFSIKGNIYSYSNFVDNLKLGEDVSSGLRIVYRADLPEYELESNYENLNQSTIQGLKEIVQGQGFKDVTVTSNSNKQIIVQVGNILDESDQAEIESLIGNPAKITFSLNSDGSNPFAEARDVEFVEVQTQVSGITYYFVKVQFKQTSIAKIAEATNEGGTLYIKLGDTSIGQMELSDTTLSEGYLDIYSEDFVDEATANTYANRIRTGMLELELTQLEIATITPSYGAGSNIMLAIAMVIFMLAGFAFLIWRYKHLGWLACFNLLFFVTIGLFLLQSIPLVHINLAGLIAMLLCLILAVDTLMNIFERAKHHYNSDVKLYVALRMAQKETLVRSFVINVTFMVAGFICLFKDR